MVLPISFSINRQISYALLIIVIRRFFLQKKEQNIMDEKQLEEYWNNKYPKVDIVYGGRRVPNCTNTIGIDVRNFIWLNDCVLSEVPSQEKLIGATIDETALLCQKYIVNNYQYTSDESQFGYTEFWLFPFESLFLKKTDCEDGAALMASLMIYAGIPEFRVRVNAGWVLDKNGEKQGHAYVSYLRESDNQWCLLDWCFLQDPEVSVKDKPLAKDKLEYQAIWFSFNSKYSFAKTQYDIVSDLFDEPKKLFDM